MDVLFQILLSMFFYCHKPVLINKISKFIAHICTSELLVRKTLTFGQILTKSLIKIMSLL